MEIRTYIRILTRRWWAVAMGLVVVVLATWVWTMRQQPTYRSQATYVLRPHSATLQLEDDFVRALEMVSRRVEINTTFAEVATSKLIKSRARLSAGIAPAAADAYSVSASVIGGTNIMRIVAEGPDPQLVQKFCERIGVETMNYVRDLYDVFELNPLDDASLPSRPVRPSLVLNLAISSMIGLILGVGLAILIEIVRSPYDAPDTFNIIDHTTGAYNRSYFTLRLWQEMNRSKRHKYPLSLGLIKVDIEGENIGVRDRVEVTRVFKRVTESQIRSDDVLAWINGDTFAVLCAYMANEEAKEFVERLKSRFSSVAKDVLSVNGGVRLRNYSSVVTFKGGVINEASFLEKGVLELQASSASLISET
jgi:capsular polysaccharide biosynthesis protein/GGDEF domain-containing protein